MGLDTGLIIKCDDLVLPFDKNCDDIYPYDVFYFSKCWGLTRELSSLLNCPDNGDIQVEPIMIDGMIEIISQYLDEGYYNKHNGCFWTFDEMLGQCEQAIANLEYLKKLNVDYTMVYYESY